MEGETEDFAIMITLVVFGTDVLLCNCIILRVDYMLRLIVVVCSCLLTEKVDSDFGGCWHSNGVLVTWVEYVLS